MGDKRRAGIVVRSLIALGAALLLIGIAAPADARHVVWSDLFGTPGDEFVGGIAVDDRGRAHIAGDTTGALPVESLPGGRDAFVAAYGSGTAEGGFLGEDGAGGRDAFVVKVGRA